MPLTNCTLISSWRPRAGNLTTISYHFPFHRPTIIFTLSFSIMHGFYFPDIPKRGSFIMDSWITDRIWFVCFKNINKTRGHNIPAHQYQLFHSCFRSIEILHLFRINWHVLVVFSFHKQAIYDTHENIGKSANRNAFFHKTEYIIYCFALTPQTGVNGPFNDIIWKKCDLYDADNTLHPTVLTCANSWISVLNHSILYYSCPGDYRHLSLPFGAIWLPFYLAIISRRS